STSSLGGGIVGGGHPFSEDASGIRGLSPEALMGYWEALGAPLSDESKKRITAFSHQRLADMIPDRIDTSARLANFGLPSLMICGTNDARFEGMRRFAATRDCYRFVPVQDADHLQAWFRSDRIVSEIQGFVRTVSA